MAKQIQDIVPKIEKERVESKIATSDFLNRPKTQSPPSPNLGAPVPGRLEEVQLNDSRFGIWVIVFISVVILFFALSFLFKGAKVTITPKMVELTLEESFTAFKDGAAGELSFEVAALSGEEIKSVLANVVEDVERKATGRVIIYNNYSSKSQRLLIETRLETPDGKIYKTDSPLTLPGITTSNGEKIPGSVEVAVHADLPGEEYNIGLSDFTILGFKGGPKYEKFYARSITEMTGGEKGELYVLPEQEGEDALRELRNVLADKLQGAISNQIPPGFVIFSGGVIYKTEEKTEFLESDTPEIELREKGTSYAFIFNERQLSRKIAEAVLSEAEEVKILIPNLSNLTFTLRNKELISPNVEERISFSLAGNITLVWDVDNDKFVSSLVGQRKKSFQAILSQFKDIDAAEVVIKPFWIKEFPKDRKDIKIVNTAEGS